MNTLAVISLVIVVGLAVPVGVLALSRWEVRARITEAEVPSHAEDKVASLEAAGFPLALAVTTRPGVRILLFQRPGDPFTVAHFVMSQRLIVTSLLATSELIDPASERVFD